MMGLTFHRTFSLSRSSISKIVGLAQLEPGFTRDALGAHTDLGTVYQEAMPRYAYRAGLLDDHNRLTVFGHYVAQHDPTLEKLGTQWLLHYHLAAPHGPTAFWRHLVCTHFLPGNTFTPDTLTDSLTEFLQSEAGKSPVPRSVRSTITVLLGTYLKADGLGWLHVLEETAPNTYQVLTSEPPPLWAFGYALAEYWNADYGNRLTINMDDLTHRDFAAVFLLGEEGLTRLLVLLKQEGVLDLYRTSRPYQVVLLQPNLEYALQRMYEM